MNLPLKMLIVFSFVCVAFVWAAKVSFAVPLPQSSEFVTTVRVNANLRAGPSTEFERIGGAKAATTIVLVGCTSTGDWCKTNGEEWIFAELLTVQPVGLPVVAVQAPDVPLNTPQSTPNTDGKKFTFPAFVVNTDGVPNAVPSPTPVSYFSIDTWLRPGQDVLSGLKIPSLAPANVTTGLEHFFRDNLLLVVILLVLLSPILLMVLIGKWLWAYTGLVMTCILSIPGYIATIALCWMALTNHQKIRNQTPKEFVESTFGTSGAEGVMWVLLIVLTAVSVLGGVIVVGIIMAAYHVALALLPGPPKAYSTPISTSNAVGNVATYAYSDDTPDSSWRPGTLSRAQERELDRDINDTDDRSGSIWDGWLVKW